MKPCNLWFGPDPCTRNAVGRGMCGTHYWRWRKGDRGEALNRPNQKRRCADDPLHEILKAICRVQAETIIDQERLLNAAALIVSFASLRGYDAA